MILAMIGPLRNWDARRATGGRRRLQSGLCGLERCWPRRRWCGRPRRNRDVRQKALARVGRGGGRSSPPAPRVVGEETLRQKVVQRAARFRPRVGSDMTPPPLKYKTREIVSEYGYSALRDSPNALHEFREVTKVDGRQVMTQETARRTLTLGVTSQDDRLKKRILETFEKHGLVGAATDFGQVLLLFGKRRLGDYEFEPAGKGRLRDEDALGLIYRQTEGKETFTIFEGRKESSGDRCKGSCGCGNRTTFHCGSS